MKNGSLPFTVARFVTTTVFTSHLRLLVAWLAWVNSQRIDENLLTSHLRSPCFPSDEHATPPSAEERLEMWERLISWKPPNRFRIEKQHRIDSYLGDRWMHWLKCTLKHDVWMKIIPVTRCAEDSTSVKNCTSLSTINDKKRLSDTFTIVSSHLLTKE